MVTSPMKKWPALRRRLLFSRRMTYLLGSRRRRCCPPQNYVPMIVGRYWAQKSAKMGLKKAQGSRELLTPSILQPRTTDLACKFFTLIPSRMYMLPERLRASTWRRVPEHASVPSREAALFSHRLRTTALFCFLRRGNVFFLS